MKPEVMPEAAGNPCWSRSSVEARLSPIAQLSDAKADWFLATHSPIQCLLPAGESVNESALFDRLYRSGSPEQLVVIKGPPGAGKSQLINWLRLRFQDALSRGENRHGGGGRLRTVLIRRRSGSLKDALEQLVAQLPQYERFLADVTAAIAQISDDQARRKLSFEIAVVLLGLQQKGELPDDLKHLHQLFQDIRMMEVMCRPNGTIDRNIQRLTSESDVLSRENLPTFTAEDFDFRGKRRGLDVDTLMLDLLEDEEALRVEAAKIVNSVLREALANVTGIKGQTLHEVFRGIRRAMFQAGEELALFVEDVSTMSILDEELVNALEPQGDTDLCRILSVLGMTIPAYNRLQENKKDRITLALEIPGDFGNAGSLADADQTDRFVARYLNALRVGEAQISVLAEDRRLHNDVLRSACDDCIVRDKCFGAFSSVRFGEAEVGLYPLAPGAASRILEGLEATSSSRNPRGLLRHVVMPLLEIQGGKSRAQSNSFGIDLTPQMPSDLAQASQTLLGGWNGTQKSQLSYLTWYWSGGNTIVEARLRIEPMLPWFGLPPFTGGSTPPPGSESPKTQVKVKGPATPDSTPKEPASTPPLLVNARQRLQVWLDQKKKLTKDAEYRDLLLGLVKSSLDEENSRFPSSAMRDLATGNGSLTRANIQIEDMDSNPAVASKARFAFPRNHSTYDLLNALLDFQYLGGGKSWDFEGAIAQQRVYAKWLLRHREDMLRAYNVTRAPSGDVQRIAAIFLVIAYRFCRRSTVSSDTAIAVESLTSFDVSEPTTMTKIAQKLASDANLRVQKVRTFLFRQLSVPQGGARSLNYIDTRVLQEIVSQHRVATQLPSLDHPNLESDFPEIYQLVQSDWSRLGDALREEHAELVVLLEDLRSVALRWDIEAEEVQEERDPLALCMKSFLQSARAVEKACSDAKQSMGQAELQARIKDLTPAKVTSLTNCLDDALRAEAAGPNGILNIDIGPLLKLHILVQEIDEAMIRLSSEVASQMAELVTPADVEAERSRAQDAVQRLGACLNIPGYAEQMRVSDGDQ
jgi:hypothetical protein